MEQKILTIRELYPHLNDEERALAEENLDQYLLLVLEIFEDIEAEAGRTGRSFDELLRRGKLEISKGAESSQG